jgi:NAD(P)-dependent dehydrogenase (short-subunit alcohol dehydrogenase family)
MGGLDLSGRKALVTGGAQGLGEGMAKALAAAGAKVVISDIQKDSGEAVADALDREYGGGNGFVAHDITDEGSWENAVVAANDILGGLDILVNNAAYQMAQPGGITDITTEQFDRVMKTNLYAMFWLCRAAVPHMQPGATIINTASIQAYLSSSALLDYATTKGGIVAFTKALAEDLAKQGIRVNAVAPGPIWTPLIPSTMPSEKVKSFGGDTPLGRAGQPAEVAPAYVYFASQESSYTTGEVLGVTGGKPVS